MDPHTSRWQSADPAGFDLANPMGEDGKPRQGYSIVEGMNWYVYCGNNPLRYTDPTGLLFEWVQGDGVTDEQFANAQALADEIMNSDTEAGRRMKELYDSEDITVKINILADGKTFADAENWDNATNGTGSNSSINFNINDSGTYLGESVNKDIGAVLVHEISGHAWDYAHGISAYNGAPGKGTWQGKLLAEQNAVGLENEYRFLMGLQQRPTYNKDWNMPMYSPSAKGWFLIPGELVNGMYYRRIVGQASPWEPNQ